MNCRLCALVVFFCGLIGQGGCCFFRDTCAPGYDPYSVNGRTIAPVSVWLDNHPAEWGGTGYRITGPIGPTPMFRYVINRPEVLGTIRDVSINVFRETNGQWSDTPDYIVSAAETDTSPAGLRPKKTYRLGIPGEVLRVEDAQGQAIDAMALEPDTRYLMGVVVSGDRRESMRIEFQTR